MESKLEGDIDLQGFLEIKDDVPKDFRPFGCMSISNADCPVERQEEIASPTYSPVFDTITRPVPGHGTDTDTTLPPLLARVWVRHALSLDLSQISGYLVDPNGFNPLQNTCFRVLQNTVRICSVD